MRSPFAGSISRDVAGFCWPCCNRISLSSGRVGESQNPKPTVEAKETVCRSAGVRDVRLPFSLLFASFSPHAFSYAFLQQLLRYEYLAPRFTRRVRSNSENLLVDGNRFGGGSKEVRTKLAARARPASSSRLRFFPLVTATATRLGNRLLTVHRRALTQVLLMASV